jgi:hypothetical protein
MRVLRCLLVVFVGLVLAAARPAVAQQAARIGGIAGRVQESPPGQA